MDKPAILLRDVDLVKDVLTTSFSCFKDNDFVVDETVDPLISQNPFAARGPNWKVARSNMAPLFTSMKVCFFSLYYTRTLIPREIGHPKVLRK